MEKSKIKDSIEECINNLNSFNASKIISLVDQNIKVHSMKNGNIITVGDGINQFKNFLNIFNKKYQFIYWKILDYNIKNEFAEITVKQKIFFIEDMPFGPKAWDMKEQIARVFFKFEKSKIKNIFIIHVNT